MTIKRGPSFLLILFAYIAAFTAAALTAGYADDRFGLFFSGIIADIAATLVIFAFSMIYRNSSAYDPYWSAAPPVLYFYWAVRLGRFGDLRTIMVLAVTLLWAVRLTTNWMRDWDGLTEEDWRYVEFRIKFGKAYPAVSLGGIHMFPTLMVGLASVPAWMAMQGGPGRLGIWDILGLLTSGGAALLCYIADEQMRRHRESGRGGIYSGGLWSVVRHPNYLGEIMFWFGLWFLALGASPANWWTGAGAAAMFLMFRFVSAPWMERKVLKTRPEYGQIQASIPMLIPMPGKSMKGAAVS
jgi:steroid 5-alpha reductase family enzyme